MPRDFTISSATSRGDESAIELRDVGRTFGAVRALYSIDLAVRPGEIVALVGDNGAGKSTLMNIMCGAEPPDEGEVLVAGELVQDLAHAQKLGVGMVYQDLALAPHLSVVENMFLGREENLAGWRGLLRWIDRRRMRNQAKQSIADLGISTLRNVDLPVWRLSGGQRQVAAVARAMMWTRTAVLLDEPTAALGPKQVGMVLDAIRTAASRGIAVVIISHDIPHVLKLADRVVVLRRGTIVAELDPTGLSVTQVVAEMIGDEATSDSPESESPHV
ncbi:MAG: ATP-binding cassette domain-containing protein [Herbiconiux sp.]|nr:ATP-binding cassette domain-containing protein [Herbiconiux sp.]